MTPTDLFRVTATPAGIHLADALSQALHGEGATVEGAWVDRPKAAGWAIHGSAAEGMSIVVRAVDSAAVHRAVAKIQAKSGPQLDIEVIQLDRSPDRPG